MIFRPSIMLSLTLVILALLFLQLGLWQLDRMAEKQDLFDRFDSAPAVPLESALRNEERFARVEATGRYDTDRHILLDNKIWQGRAGVHVLTPFTPADGTTLLVNRGWLPLAADRRSLPMVPTPAGAVTIHGRLNNPGGGERQLGETDIMSADTWPQLVTYYDSATVESALGQELPALLLQLDAADPSGFEGRAWKAAAMEPRVHGGYAVQWFALMATAIIIWIVLGIRRGRLILHKRQTAARNEPDGAGNT